MGIDVEAQGGGGGEKVQVSTFFALVLLLTAVACAARPTAVPSPTPEPLVPTRTAVGADPSPAAGAALGPSATPTPAETSPPPATTGAPSATPAATGADPTPDPAGTPGESTLEPTARPPALASPSATPSSATRLATATGAAVAPPLVLPQGRGRFGVGVVSGAITDYAVGQLGIGWYLNWGVRIDPPRPAGAEFWQMVRVSEGGYRPDAATIRRAAEANPGAFWIIGNEPDVIWQDSTTPERYAGLYHELYHLLKAADPTCRVVIAGVSQATPLRLAYLERILEAYRARYGEPMPVDVWNVHGFILREERGSWGVDIPPGFGQGAGTLYEIDDHDDLAILRGQIRDFRRWMADHGQRDKPLVVSEYGILMPADYGFGPAAVRSFMEGSFDFFSTASDGSVGYPQDGNRLVQWWCWYSLAAPESYYPTGNLFDPDTKALTALGRAFADY